MPKVDSAPKVEYHIPVDKGGRCVGVTTLPPSCAECHDWFAVSVISAVQEIVCSLMRVAVAFFVVSSCSAGGRK